MATRKKAFDALDELEESCPSKEWAGYRAKDIRAYIFSLEMYIKTLEEDYDELDHK